MNSLRFVLIHLFQILFQLAYSSGQSTEQPSTSSSTHNIVTDVNSNPSISLQTSESSPSTDIVNIYQNNNNNNDSSSNIGILEWLSHPYTLATMLLLVGCCFCFILSLVWCQKSKNRFDQITNNTNKPIIRMTSTTSRSATTRDRSNSVSNHLDNASIGVNNGNNLTNAIIPIGYDDLPVITPSPRVHKPLDTTNNRRGGISANNSTANTPEPPTSTIPIDRSPIKIDVTNQTIKEEEDDDDIVTININKDNNNEKQQQQQHEPLQLAQTIALKGPRITVHEMNEVPDVPSSLPPDMTIGSLKQENSINNMSSIANVGSALDLNRFNSANSQMSALSVNVVNRTSIDNIDSSDEMGLSGVNHSNVGSINMNGNSGNEMSRISRMTVVSKSRIPKDSNGDYDDVEAIYENNDLKMFNVLESKNYAKIIAQADENKGIMVGDEDRKIMEENRAYKVKLDFGPEWGADRITIPPSSRGTFGSRSSMLSNNSYNNETDIDTSGANNIKMTMSGMSGSIMTDIINDNEIVGSEASSGYL